MKKSCVETLVIAAALAASASAALALESVHWQTGLVEGGRVASWRDVKTLLNVPQPADRVRARLVLKNDGPQNEEGLLLRYSLTARVLPGDGGATGGAWAVPFIIDEKRVPKVGAGKTIDVALDPGASLALQLRRVTRVGWRPDLIKIQVMLEPHRGSKALQIVEDEVEVGRGTKNP